jgi:hypothetical protein
MISAAGSLVSSSVSEGAGRVSAFVSGEEVSELVLVSLAASVVVSSGKVTSAALVSFAASGSSKGTQ